MTFDDRPRREREDRPGCTLEAAGCGLILLVVVEILVVTAIVVCYLVGIARGAEVLGAG